MERVCYVLGAGFSAPLGLPVSSNFISRSKDLFFNEPARYEHFRAVFGMIKAMAVAKNTFDADLSNIEEVLSIIEMDTSLGGGAFRETFVKYIADVIEAFTPDLPPIHGELSRSDWSQCIFKTADWPEAWKGVGHFVCNLFGLRIHNQELRPQPIRLVCKPPRAEAVQYSIVTLNYDQVLERTCGFMRRQWGAANEFAFGRPSHEDDVVGINSIVPLAKLHGCVGSESIVAPTWNKSLNKEILPEWRLAKRLLSAANHIRFIGYSLPPTDAYFRYLMKASALTSEHLKSIDVLCYDPLGSVRQNFESFIVFPNLRFTSNYTEYYLQGISQHDKHPQRNYAVLTFNGLEEQHRQVFKNVSA